MKPKAKKKLMDLLTDPVRARIFLEAFLQREVTAEYLMSQLAISRSTLSYHLSKLVELGALDVRINSVGRPVKYYYLSKDFEFPAKDEPEIVDGDWLSQRIMWTEQTLVELQAITNMVITGLKRIKQWKASKEESDGFLSKLEHSPKCFTMHATNEDGARMWYKKYVKFLVDFETELLKIHEEGVARGDKFEYVVFSGLIPIVTYHSLIDSK